MPSRALALALTLIAALWASWMARYEPIQGTSMVLDRWTGEVHEILMGTRYDLSGARDEFGTEPRQPGALSAPGAKQKGFTPL